MDKSILTDKKTIIENDFLSTYNQLYIHPEEGEDFKINASFNDIEYDLNNVNSIIVEATNNIDTLIKSTIERLDIINTNIIKEKERLQDIKMLCNKYTDFDKVIIVNDSNMKLYGNCNYDNGVFSSAIGSFKSVNLSLNNVTGNGYIGNKYIYKDNDYIENSLDTSKSNALFDKNIATYWEYQRITASSTEEYLLNDFYMDSEEAKCTLTLEADEEINELFISTDLNNIKIIDMKYSDDNIDYEDITLPVITLNNKLESYNNFNYIYGSGLLIVPNCKYLKVTFQSGGNTNESVAFNKVMFLEDIFEETNNNDLTEEIVKVKSAKRHLIKINDIKAYSNTYENTSYFMTEDILKGSQVYSISVFANVYLPEDISSNNVEFILTVNGIDYSIIPINDNENNGTKIIRYSKGSSKTEYTQLTNEVITSAVLTVKVKSSKNLTPYISNVKFLLGGEI